MDVCDAAEEAETFDEATTLEQAKALVGDLESSAMELGEDLRYPVDAHGRVMFVNYLHPDLMPTVVYHLIRCGWRKNPTKALVKRRKVVGSPFADLVAYVPLTDPDGPIYAPRAEPNNAPWSVRPNVNVIDEKRQT